MSGSGRYDTATSSTLRVAAGWTLSTVLAPSALYGANGMKIGPDGQLYVAQAFGSQLSALDPDSGAVRTVIPVGSAVVAPDDLAFDSHGVMYITEVMSERVSARMPDGSLRVIADNVPVANGITSHGDRIFMDEMRPDGRLLELYADGRAPRVVAEHLNFPNALAMGPDDCLYFPQVVDGEIWRVPVAGGRPERFVSGLAFPTAVKFSPRGELYTTEAASGEVTRIDLHSRARHTVAKVRAGIDNFAFSPAGRLFVSHFVDGGVTEIDAAGHERVLVAPGMLGPFGLACGADGRIYVADGMSLAVHEADGRLAVRHGLLIDHSFPGFARGVAVDSDGAAYITTSAGSVARYRSGEQTRTLASSLERPTGLTLAADGGLLVCETGGGRLLHIATDGKLSTLARGLAAPVGVAALADGSCFVSESAAGRVTHIENGQTRAVMNGLREPQGLAWQGGSVFVVDRTAKTLHCYTPASGSTIVVAEQLPVGATPGIVPKTLPGIGDIMPGPLLPFADLVACSDGRILIGADGAGAVLAVSRA